MGILKLAQVALQFISFLFKIVLQFVIAINNLNQKFFKPVTFVFLKPFI